MKNTVFAAAICAASFAAVSPAFAEDCTNLGANPTWRSNFASLESAIEGRNYDAAIESAKILFGICQRSPALNYYTGVAMKAQGDKKRAAYYFVKASEYTSEMAVAPGLSQRIWYERYESEHPEATPEALKEMQDKYDAQVAATVDLQEQIRKQSEDLKVKLATENASETTLLYGAMRNWRAGMWTAIGVTAAGVALTIAGAIMPTAEDILVKSDKSTSGWRVNQTHNAGWALMGLGIGLSVTGAAMSVVSGIMYSKYSRNYNAIIERTNNVNESSAVSYNFSIAPNGAAFELAF